MKATGVVRRIDDLGRIVIPKEIRKTLRIKEGDPLEIFTDREGQVILKKYSPIGELSEFATEYAETLAKTTGHIACITDKDMVIAVSGGSKKEFGWSIEEETSWGKRQKHGHGFWSIRSRKKTRGFGWSSTCAEKDIPGRISPSLRNSRTLFWRTAVRSI